MVVKGIGLQSIKSSWQAVSAGLSTYVKQNYVSLACMSILHCIWILPLYEAKVCFILLTFSQHDPNFACT